MEAEPKTPSLEPGTVVPTPTLPEVEARKAFPVTRILANVEVPVGEIILLA
jgi:hypothetical protein